MKKHLAALILFLEALFLCGAADAANIFVRQGAGGANNGSDWTNALTSMPTPSAGNTYYIADGSYGNIAVQASNFTIKKCSTTDGVSPGISGYLATYCDGKAVFTGGSTSGQRSNFTIDGSYRNESDWSDHTSYGFQLSGGFSSIDGQDPSSDYCGTQVTLKYIHFGIDPNPTFSEAYADEVLKGTGYRAPHCLDWTVQRNLLTNAAHFCLFCANLFVNPVIEYNRFQYGWGKEAIRGQTRFSGGKIRWNQFYDSCGSTSVGGEGCTAEIALWGGGPATGDFDGNEVYGNWFYTSNTNRHDGTTGGTIVVGGDNGVGWEGPPVTGTKVYNNTRTGFANSVGAQQGLILVNGVSATNECRNNLAYNVANPSVSCTTTSSNMTAGSNPFVSIPSDLHLSADTSTTWTALASPYNVDMDGVTRTSSVGAYQYVSGDPEPNAPTNLRLITWLGLLVGVGAVLGMFVKGLRNGGAQGDSRDGRLRPARSPGGLGGVAANRLA